MEKKNFKEYTFRDLVKTSAGDFLLYAIGCISLCGYMNWYVAFCIYLILCYISIEGSRSEFQDKQIHSLKDELKNIKNELSLYKQQVLEG